MADYPYVFPMMGAFNFNGVASQTHQLISKSVKRPLLPAAKPQRVELGSASGAYDFPGLEYGLRQVQMQIAYIGTDYNNLRSRARTIAAWLAVGEWKKLIMDDEQDKYYLAKVTSETNLQTLFESGTADVTFDCQPFAYSVQQQTVNLGSSGSFTNPGTRQINYKSPQGSLFKMTVTGSSPSITMNGKTLTYASSGTAVIDCIEMEITSGGSSIFSSLDGDIDTFFELLPGSNSVSSTASSITIDYIPMWY